MLTSTQTVTERGGRAGAPSQRVRFAACVLVLLSACVDGGDDLFSELAAGVPPGTASADGMPGGAAPEAPSSGDDAEGSTGDEAGAAGPLPIDGAPAPGAGSDGATGAASADPGLPGEPAPSAVQSANPARACPAIGEPLLLDFDAPASSPEQALFGDFNLLLSGGTYVYPQLGAGTLDANPGAAGLQSVVTEGDWHIFGNVEQPSGFGLFFSCQLIDASAFVGIAFRVQGNVELGQAFDVRLGSAAQEVSHDWFVQQGNGSVGSFGRCFPAESQFDGSCEPPSASVTVSPQGADIVIPFSAFANGAPVAGLDPRELTALSWRLPDATLDADGALVPYAVDLRIDDIRFVTSLTPGAPGAAPAADPAAPAEPEPPPVDPGPAPLDPAAPDPAGPDAPGGGEAATDVPPGAPAAP